MANLLGADIGTNYKGILSLDSTINTPLDATLRAVTDGEGDASPLQLSTTSVSFGGADGLNWNDTNNRLGIGTNAPTASIEATTFKSSSINDNGAVLQFLPSYNMYTLSQFSIGAGDMAARFGVKGYGTTSATTALLVQNSAGTDAFKVRDDGAILMGFGSTSVFICDSGGPDKIRATNVGVGIEGSPVTSAALAVNGTSKGFLPPRMTTTQKNAISSPAAGLVVYDETTNKLACYNGTTWNDLF